MTPPASHNTPFSNEFDSEGMSELPDGHKPQASCLLEMPHTLVVTLRTRVGVPHRTCDELLAALDVHVVAVRVRGAVQRRQQRRRLNHTHTHTQKVYS
jgi:hypothetical protein